MKKISLIAGMLLSMRVLAQSTPSPDALPTGGRVVAGEAGIAQDGATMNIQQSSERVAIDWNSFNVGSAAQINFVQPSRNAVALNRVTGADVSRIFGRINANGQIFLSNANGVYFAPTASVDVGGLVATTHAIDLADFMAGRVRFERHGATGSVVNEGELRAALGGYVALLAPEVRNQGVILANLGTVALAAGEGFELQFDSNNTLASLRVTPAAIQALVENRSAVLAPGGLVLLSAQAIDRIQGGVIRNTGVIEATGIAQRGGRIVLESSGAVTLTDALLDSSSTAGTGGEITILGQDISLQGATSLVATGATGGGTVRIGGDWQGGGELPQATSVDFGPDARIDVSATQLGDGGTAVLWSDVYDPASFTLARGSIAAHAGRVGNGGRIETSGHRVDTTGLRVNASSTSGTAGLWLIDPYDYNIDASAAASINSALSGGSSVTISTTAQNTGLGSSSNSGDAGDITVSSAITKNGGGDVTLTLQAHRRVTVAAPITSSAGALNLVLWSDYGNTDAAGVGMTSGGTISTNGGHVWIGGSASSGGSYTWNGLTVGDGPSVGSVAANYNGMDLGANITTGGGDVFIWAATGVSGANTGPGIGLDGARNINVGSGDITLITDRAFDFANAGTLSLDTTGMLTLAPTGGSFDAAFNWTGTATAGNFRLNNTLSANTLTINSIASLGGLNIGRYAGLFNGATPVVLDNSSDVTLSSALNLAGPIIVHGDNVTASASVTSTLAGAGLLLKGLRKVTVDGNLTTNGGDITLWSNSQEATDGGIEIRNSRSLSSSGGWITLGGSAGTIAGLPSLSLLGSALPVGYARNGTSVAGVSLGTGIGAAGQNSGISIASGGGRIGVAGHSTVYGANGGNSYSFGVLVHNGVNVNAGSGDIVLHGLADGSGGANRYNFGVDWSPFNTSGSAAASTWTTQGGNIQLNGTASGSVTGNIGLSVDSGTISAVTVQNTGTGGGSVAVTGTASGGTNSAEAVRFSSTNLLAASGTIDLLASAGSYHQAATRLNLGWLSGSAVTSSTADITVAADTLAGVSSATLTLRTSGAFTLEPVGTSFSSALNWPAFSVGSVLGGLTLGKPGNTANITVGSGLTVAGPINLFGGSITTNAGVLSTNNSILVQGSSITTHAALQASSGTITLQGGDLDIGASVQAPSLSLSGGSLAIGGALQATGGTITLQFTGNVTDSSSGSVSANNLLLLGGNFTLNSANNAITTLAAVNVGALTWFDSDAMTVGTVGGTSGISASGPVSIATLTGDLTIAENISTTDTTSTALTLNAGRNAVAGTSTGGNLLLSGNPTLSMGSGGTARLFTGSVAGSTAIATMVGSGSGRFRYNSDETATNYTLALNAGLNAIYREQPTITRAINGQSITYGDSLQAWTFSSSGTLNGDTDAQAFANGAAVSVGGSVSTSGNPVAGTHALTATGGTSQLGYAVNGTIGSSTLNVAQRTLTASYAAASRIYDGTNTATVIAGTDRVTGDALSIGWTSATFADKNAGNGKSVSISGVSISGTDAANYTLASSTGSATANIAARLLTATYTAASRAYDGTNLASVTASNDRLAGDALTIGWSSATFADKNAGNGKSVSIAGASLTGTDAGNYTIAASGNTTADITPRTLTLSAARTYDGTTALGTVSLGNLVGSESLTYGGATASDAQVATSGKYITAITLANGSNGGLASNYQLPALNAANAPVTITPRPLQITYAGIDRAYNGGTQATVTTTDDRVAGDTLVINRNAAFDDKNVGTGKHVSVTQVALAGAHASNYTLTSNSGNATASITRLPAVTWTGGPTGNWFDPANWAGGAVPDLANVANVVIPANVVVTFDTGGAVAPAQTGPVQLDSLGTAGSLHQVNGVLEIGAGGVALSMFLQSGGSFSNSGSLTAGGKFSGGWETGANASATARNSGKTGGVVPGNFQAGDWLRALSAQSSPVMVESAGPGLYSVHVTSGQAIAGFTIDLPASLLADIPAQTAVQVQTEGGDELPSWLSYNEQRGQLIASAPGSLPLRVHVSAGDRHAVLVISIDASAAR